jgi:hypothetical protein
MKYYTPVQLLDILLHILTGILQRRSAMCKDSTLPMDIQQLVNLCIEGPFNSAEASIHRCKQAMNSLETDRRLLAEKIQIQSHAVAQIKIHINVHRVNHMVGFANKLDIALYEQLVEANQALGQLEMRNTEYGMAVDTIRHFLGLLMAQKKWSTVIDHPYMFEVPVFNDVKKGNIEELPEAEEVQENVSDEEADTLTLLANIDAEHCSAPPRDRKRKAGDMTSDYTTEGSDSMDVEMGEPELPPSKRVCLREESPAAPAAVVAYPM